MNSKAFRKNHASKHKSASSTFISLHFNKADEEQVEISYKNDNNTNEDVMSKSAETLKSNFSIYTKDADPDVSCSSSDKNAYENKIETNVASDFVVHTPFNKISVLNSTQKIFEDPVKSKITKVGNPNFYTDAKNYTSNFEVLKQEQNDEKNTETTFTDTVDSTLFEEQLKLSPAMEAAEVEINDSFSQYINEGLEKAKCEILDLKKENQSSLLSPKDLNDALSPPNLQDGSKINHRNNEPKVSQASKKKFFDEQLHSYHFIQQSVTFLQYIRNSVKFHLLIALLACVCAPIPSWLSGFLAGAILSSSVVYWLYKPQKSIRRIHNFVLPQKVENHKFQEDSGILKGWMNELPSFMNYNPEQYHVSCTKSVYVRLDGSYLRFSFSQKNIPKRAMFNEPRHDMQFVYQQHYDIADATIELLPKGLPNKRLWSKKYPICIKILNSKEAVLSNSTKADCVEGPFGAKTNKKDNFSKKFVPRINENNEIVIYLFSRTDRDKSLWFSRFLKASRLKIGKPQTPTLSTRISETDSLENKRTLSVDFASLQYASAAQDEQYFSPGSDEVDDSFVEISITKPQKFEMYMSSLLAPLHMEHPIAAAYLKKEKKDSSDKKELKSGFKQSSLTWLNVLIGRLFFDFLVEDTWAQLVSQKIQRKLNKIKLPFFLTELTVKDINLGSALPKIHHASEPSVDEKGLWIDVDISYNGSCQMTLETKLSLQRSKADSDEFWDSLSNSSKQSQATDQTKSSLDSDEDSMESSSDDEVPLLQIKEDGCLKENALSNSSGSKGKKFLKFVDRLTQSPYFQHATKNKFVKKAMEDLSNTPLVLTVEVQWLTGTLAINIPPWPTDRLWYGFRTNPSLSITARPKLGQHVVTFTQVTEWIEKKLVSEFQKLLVMPNMDDLIIPLMQPSHNIP